MVMERANNPESDGIRVAAMNEELLLGLVRQHELTEMAELLIAQLRAEILARQKAEDALVRSEKLASSVVEPYLRCALGGRRSQMLKPSSLLREKYACFPMSQRSMKPERLLELRFLLPTLRNASVQKML